MNRVVIVIHTNTYFTGMLPLAMMLKRNPDFEPVFLFTRYYPTLPEDIRRCTKEAISVTFNDDVILTDLPENKNGKTRTTLIKMPVLVIKIINRLKNYSETILNRLNKLFFFSVINEISQLSRQIKNFKGYLSIEKISMVILPADNRYDQAAYIKAAHQKHIKAILVPQFMAGPLEWVEYVWSQEPYQVKTPFAKLVADLFPRWKLNYKNHDLTALPISQLVAREWLQIAPPLPWVLHSGNADAVALESEAVRDYCLAEGLTGDKFQVTGSIAHDEMAVLLADFSKNRKVLCEELGFSEEKPIILTALPPDNLYMNRPDCDFKTYADLVEFWCQSISVITGFHHVVVLHPSLRYEEISYIENFGLRISKRNTASVIPLCDLYVSSISSTIQWAIACQKPVLNYDVFRYHYTDYQKVGGVISVEEKQDFIDALHKISTDRGYYGEITERQIQEASYWGKLDGKAGDRLCSMFSLMLNKSNKVSL